MGMASRASLTDDERKLFPLKTVSSVVSLVESILKRTSEPDLALLSILIGCIENTLTCNVSVLSGAKSTVLSPATSIEENSEKLVVIPPIRKEDDFPEIDWPTIEALYVKFRAIIKSSVDLTQFDCPEFATRELVKKVSDVIWNTLTRSYYKDRAHLQSLYSYLTGNKLDCFGVALAVVAGCQVLGFNDVHLALSEDHAWVTFGPEHKETAEVTWHGKGNEDKRGQPVDPGILARSWLYVAGNPVICSRFTELASLVSSINPSITATTDSLEVASLQQSLLWVLYDAGHLDKYPMALGNLADLEELNPTVGRTHCSQLFSQAIDVARRFYGNSHVYPYTYQGGYFYRNRLYKEALESWANAADAIRSYNYSREDEEIYKEFLEIANELIPFVMKVEGSGHSARSILKDSECFAHLLRFYDGICKWEEGSCTPVLHIGWAKPLVNTISKFDSQVRRHVVISCSDVAEGETKQDIHPTEDKPEFHREDLDANGNQVVHPLGKEQENEERLVDKDLGGKATEPKARLGSTALAALTDLCGRTVLSPAFFLGTAAAAAVDCPVKTMTKPQLYLRSHKMAGLKDLLLSEKLNTHAISLQLTAQSQVQLGGRKLRGEEAKDAKQDGRDVTNPSRPKRNRKD
uniref:Menin n=1 Tax=Scapholeberis mucronata TaxID=202097 RepID=A0A4Y7NJY5_9CRUS|nr:EOG090X0424 [Scapholeberis mucronata]SVE93539.1 EOG090X0424 [Scapholeberis mucronata]